MILINEGVTSAFELKSPIIFISNERPFESLRFRSRVWFPLVDHGTFVCGQIRESLGLNYSTNIGTSTGVSLAEGPWDLAVSKYHYRSNPLPSRLRSLPYHKHFKKSDLIAVTSNMSMRASQNFMLSKVSHPEFGFGFGIKPPSESKPFEASQHFPTASLNVSNEKKSHGKEYEILELIFLPD